MLKRILLTSCILLMAFSVLFYVKDANALSPPNIVTSATVYPENTDNPFLSSGLAPLSTFSRVYESSDRVIALDAHNGKVFAYTYNNTNGVVTSRNITISDGSFIATRLTFVSAIESDYSTFAIGRDNADNKLIFVKFDAATMAVLATYSTTSSDWPQDIMQTKTKVYFAAVVSPSSSPYESLGVINRDFTGFNDNLVTIDANSGNLDALTGYQGGGPPNMNEMAPLHIATYDTSPERLFFFYVGEKNVFPYAPIYMKRYDVGGSVIDLGIIPDADTNADNRDFVVVPLVDKMLVQIPVYDSNTATRSTSVYSIGLNDSSPGSHPPEAAIIGHDNNYIDQATKIPSIPSNITSHLSIATFSPSDPQVSCDTSYGSNIVGEQSLWFSYTPPEAQLVHVNMTGTNINLNTFGDNGVEFAIFAADDASTNNLKEVGCASFNNFLPSQQEVIFGAQPGITYYIMVYYIDRFQDTYHMGLYGDTVILHVYEDQPTTILSQTKIRTLYPQTYQISPSDRVWNTDPIEVSDKVFSYYLTPSTGVQTVGPAIINDTNHATQQLSTLDDSHYYFLPLHNLLLEKQDSGFKYHPAFAAGVSATAQGSYEVNDILNNQPASPGEGFGAAMDVANNNLFVVDPDFFLTKYTLHPLSYVSTIQLVLSGNTGGGSQGSCSQNLAGGVATDHSLNSFIVFCPYGDGSFPPYAWLLKFDQTTTAFSAFIQLPATLYRTHMTYDENTHMLYILYDYCNGSSGDSCIYRINTSTMTIDATIYLSVSGGARTELEVDSVHDVLYVVDTSTGNSFDELRILSPASTSAALSTVAFIGSVGTHGMIGLDTSLNELLVTTAPTFSCASSYEIWDISTPSSPSFVRTNNFPDCFLPTTNFDEQRDDTLRIDSTRHLMIAAINSNDGAKNGLNVIDITTNTATGAFDPGGLEPNLVNLDTTNHVAILEIDSGFGILSALDYTTFHPGTSGTLPTLITNAIDGNLSTATTNAVFPGSSFSFTVEVDYGSVSTTPIYAKIGDNFTGCYTCALDIYVYTSTDGSSFSFLTVDSQFHSGSEGITEHSYSAVTTPYRYVMFLFKPIGEGASYNTHFKLYEFARGDGGYAIKTILSPIVLTTTQYEETLDQPLQSGFYTIYGGLLKLNCDGISYNVNATFQSMIVGSTNGCTSWDVYDLPNSLNHRTIAPFANTISAVHTIPFTKIAIHLTGLTNYNDYLYRSFYNGFLVDAQHPTVNRGTVFQSYLLGQCYDSFLYQISTGLSTSLGVNCGAPTVPSTGGGGGAGGSGTTGTNSGNSLVPLENVNVPSGSFGTDWPYSISRLFNSPTTGTSSVTFDFQSRAVPYNASVLVTDSWITSQQHFKQWINCSPITTQCLGVVGASNLTSVNLQTFNNRTLYFFVYDNHGIARVTAVSNGQTTQLANPFVNLGNLFGVPVLALFPVMMSLLFPKSLAPIGFAVVAAVMGYMALVGLLSLPAAVFGVIGLIAGIGLLLGVRR